MPTPPDQGLCPWTPDPRYRLALRARHVVPPLFRRNHRHWLNIGLLNLLSPDVVSNSQNGEKCVGSRGCAPDPADELDVFLRLRSCSKREWVWCGIKEGGERK